MLLGTRKSLRRTARALLALVAGAWLFAAVAPCTMAQSMPVPADVMDCCPDHMAPVAMAPDCDMLAAFDCQKPQPTPPSASTDVPVSTPVLLYTLPLALDPPLPQADRPYARADGPPPPLPLNRKQSRLLI